MIACSYSRRDSQDFVRGISGEWSDRCLEIWRVIDGARGGHGTCSVFLGREENGWTL